MNVDDKIFAEFKKIPKLESEVAGIYVKLDEHRTSTEARFNRIDSALNQLLSNEANKTFPWALLLGALGLLGGFCSYWVSASIAPLNIAISANTEAVKANASRIESKTRDRFDQHDGEKLEKRVEKIESDFYMPRFLPKP